MSLRSIDSLAPSALDRHAHTICYTPWPLDCIHGRHNSALRVWRLHGRRSMVKSGLRGACFQALIAVLKMLLYAFIRVSDALNIERSELLGFFTSLVSSSLVPARVITFSSLAKEVLVPTSGTIWASKHHWHHFWR